MLYRSSTSGARFLLLASLVMSAVAQRQHLINHDANVPTCVLLDSYLPGRVACPGDKIYNTEIESYWAINQGQQYPACLVMPQTSYELQRAVSVIHDAGANFAVRSGGHSVVANTSNIADGVTIDLQHLNRVTIDLVSGYIDIGAGATWREVYAELEGTDYLVAGARAGSVGVGGYLLGGGLSILAGRMGWACDQIMSMHVALSDGSLIKVSALQHEDLFLALKGGATNFGIVTDFRVRLLRNPQNLKISFLNYHGSGLDGAIEAVTEYITLSDDEPLTTISLSVGGSMDGAVQYNLVATHQEDIDQSRALAPFLNKHYHINTQDDLSQAKTAQIYDDMNPGGFRQRRATVTIRSDFATLKKISKLYTEDIYPELSKIVDTSQGGLLIQPLTKSHLNASLGNPNMLALDSERSPLLLISVEVRYNDTKSDAKIRTIIEAFIERTVNISRAHQASHDYRYLNYADDSTWPFEHQRKDCKLWDKIMAISRRYDPDQVFQQQMSHRFRLGSDRRHL